MVASWVFIVVLALVALLVLASVVALVAMFISGLVKNRPWMSLTAVALGLVGFVGIGMLVAFFTLTFTEAHGGVDVPHGAVHFSELHPRIQWHGEPIAWSDRAPFSAPPMQTARRKIALFPLLGIALGVGLLAVALVRRWRSGGSCGGFPRGVLLAAFLLAGLGMFVLVSEKAGRREAHFAARHANEVLRAAKARAEAASQQAEKMKRSIDEQAEQMLDANVSIETLEDRFIAPKIPLSPDAPAAPDAPAEAPSVALPTDEAQPAKAPVEESPVPEDSDPKKVPDADRTQDESAGAAPDGGEDGPSTESNDAPQADVPQGDLPQNDQTPQADSSPEHRADSEESQGGAKESSNDGELGSDENAPTSDKPSEAVEKSPADADVDAKAIESDPALVKHEAEHAASKLSTFAESTSAVKEMAASIASFAKAIDRAVDEYTRVAAQEEKESASAVLVKLVESSTKASGKPIADARVASPGSHSVNSREAKRVAVRPNWVDEGPKRIGEVQRSVITTDEYATIEECNQAADIYLQLATYDHLMSLVDRYRSIGSTRPTLSFHDNAILADGKVALTSDGYVADRRLQALASMGIGIDVIRREIAKDEYLETVERSFGPMKKLYTQIEFTPQIDSELQRAWKNYRRGERLAVVGLSAFAILGLLGTVWGMLKVDTMTKGYYTKRLFFGVPLGIAGLVACYFLLVLMGIAHL